MLMVGDELMDMSVMCFSVRGAVADQLIRSPGAFSEKRGLYT
jgi:hypothetical protein